MKNGQGASGNALLGSRSDVGAQRGLSEFKAGRPVLISGRGDEFLALPVDGASQERIAAMRALSGSEALRLIVTSRRAKTLGIDARGPIAISLSPTDDRDAILALAAMNDVRGSVRTEEPPLAASAAIALAKAAQRLPALLIGAPGAALTFEPPIVRVDADAVARLRREPARSLSIVSEAKVPLRNGLSTRFVVFRDGIGGSAAAIVVGAPDFSRPVFVRLHSACLTGDVFGSRRCDCGDQLNLALAWLHDRGGGIILYLEQEGRGLGLANKMRAYDLQDAGLDTVDANMALGFDDDERDYQVAARMLDLLGCKQVRLLTNNPGKLDGLVGAGIDIVGRVPLRTPINADNRRYLAAKATRAGHLLDILSAEHESADKEANRETGFAPSA